MQLAVVVESHPEYEIYARDFFLVGPTRQNVGTHYYVYHQNKHLFGKEAPLKVKGCMPMEWFSIMGELEVNQPMTESLQEAEQLSLFD